MKTTTNNISVEKFMETSYIENYNISVPKKNLLNIKMYDIHFDFMSGLS